MRILVFLTLALTLASFSFAQTDPYAPVVRYMDSVVKLDCAEIHEDFVGSMCYYMDGDLDLAQSRVNLAILRTEGAEWYDSWVRPSADREQIDRVFTWNDSHHIVIILELEQWVLLILGGP